MAPGSALAVAGTDRGSNHDLSAEEKAEKGGRMGDGASSQSRPWIVAYGRPDRTSPNQV